MPDCNECAREQTCEGYHTMRHVCLNNERGLFKPMTNAERIRTLREQRGITRDELAAAIRVSPNTIYAWERGMVTPSLENAALLAEFFGVSIDFLAGRSA